jgi:hypothetical protein
MRNIFIVFVLLAPSFLFAQSVCHRDQSIIKEALMSPSSRISFTNNGGLFNGGVCWWHSRLQRASVYLVEFRPKLSPPSSYNAYKIVSSLRDMNKVVVIPGYSDFESFTRDHKLVTQKMLNVWQKIDGFLNFQWIRGISGQSSLDPFEMKRRMDTVYDYFTQTSVPVWLMAQIKGITSHSLLLLDMTQRLNGYDLTIIDSNHPLETLKIEYHIGDESLKNDNYSFVPYVGFQNDFSKIYGTLSKSCKSGFMNETLEVIKGDIEIE